MLHGLAVLVLRLATGYGHGGGRKQQRDVPELRGERVSAPAVEVDRTEVVVEYTSHALERELRRHEAPASMGSVADWFNNAMAEGSFATLECKLFD